MVFRPGVGIKGYLSEFLGGLLRVPMRGSYEVWGLG